MYKQNVRVHLHRQANTCVHLHTHVRTCVYIHIHTQTDGQVFVAHTMYMHIYIYTYICIHAHTDKLHYLLVCAFQAPPCPQLLMSRALTVEVRTLPEERVKGFVA